MPLSLASFQLPELRSLDTAMMWQARATRATQSWERAHTASNKALEKHMHMHTCRAACQGCPQRGGGLETGSWGRPRGRVQGHKRGALDRHSSGAAPVSRPTYKCETGEIALHMWRFCGPSREPLHLPQSYTTCGIAVGRAGLRGRCYGSRGRASGTPTRHAGPCHARSIVQLERQATP